MPLIAGTLIPARVLAKCPRCNAQRYFIPQSGATFFRCLGCEWAFTFGQTAAPASPAVPASGTPVTNNSGTVIAVTVTGGTVTAINVNGSATGQTAGTVLVPAGGTISLTYSVAPTWAWALPSTSGSVSAGGVSLPFTAFGTAFAAGQVLVVGTGTPSEVVVVNGTPTGTAVPVTPLANAHASTTTVAVASPAPTYPASDAVPNAPGWGY